MIFVGAALGAAAGWALARYDDASFENGGAYFVLVYAVIGGGLGTLVR